MILICKTKSRLDQCKYIPCLVGSKPMEIFVGDFKRSALKLNKNCLNWNDRNKMTYFPR